MTAKTDLMVWRPSNFTWYGIRSSNWGSTTTQWGSGGPNNGGIGSDVPLPNYPGGSDMIADVEVAQQQSNWCWAATTQMAAAYSQVTISQCQEANADSDAPIAARTRRRLRANLCNQPGWWVTKHGFTETDLWSSAISFATLQNELNANRPVPFAWLWTGGGGHAMVAVKTWVTSTESQWVSIDNPDPVNVGEQDDMLYTAWVSAWTTPLARQLQRHSALARKEADHDNSAFDTRTAPARSRQLLHATRAQLARRRGASCGRRRGSRVGRLERRSDRAFWWAGRCSHAGQPR